MSYTIFLQSMSAGLSAIGMWFIWELIREYKKFKSDTSAIIQELKGERQNYELVIGAARLKMEEIRILTESAAKSLGLEIDKVNHSMRVIQDGASRSKEFMKLSLNLNDQMNKRLAAQDSEIKSIKVQMGEVTIFKSKK